MQGAALLEGSWDFGPSCPDMEAGDLPTASDPPQLGREQEAHNILTTMESPWRTRWTGCWVPSCLAGMDRFFQQSAFPAFFPRVLFPVTRVGP